VQTFYWIEHLMDERIAEYRRLADELRRETLAEQAKRKGRQVSPSWFSFLFGQLSRWLVPDLRPSLSVRGGDPRRR
jgi:hypothetical protein